MQDDGDGSQVFSLDSAYTMQGDRLADDGVIIPQYFDRRDENQKIKITKSLLSTK